MFLHLMQQGLAAMGSQQADIGLLCPAFPLPSCCLRFLLPGFPGQLWPKFPSAVGCISLHQPLQLPLQEPFLRFPLSVGKIQQEQEVHLLSLVQYIIEPPHHITAIHQHQFLHLWRHGRLQQGLSIATDVGMSQLLRPFKGIRLRLQPAAGNRKTGQDLQRRIFAHIIYHSFFLSSSISTKACMRVAI